MLDEFLSFAYLQNLIFRGNDVALQFLQVARKNSTFEYILHHILKMITGAELF